MLSLAQWIFVGVAALAYYFLRPRKRELNLPGPLANHIPILGSMVLMESKIWIALNKFTKKYGPMCKVKLGSRTIALIGDNQIAKEMLALDPFVGRANVDEFLLFEGQNIGLLPAEGHVWEEQRRFALRQLRDFGFAKSSMESMIREEADELVERLAAFKGEPIENFKSYVALALVNSLWRIVAGKRYSQDDPRLRELSYQLTKSFEEASKRGGIIAMAPWLKYIIPDLSGYTGLRKTMANIVDFVGNVVKEHKETFQEDSSRDFIDAYLKEIKNTTDKSSSFYGQAAEKQLIAMVSDLYQAGTESTSSTMNWAILHLINRPEMQKKMQAEITAITGDSRPASLTDRPNMPYTIAFISELLRMSLAPFGAPHRVLSDTEFHGVFFPKGTFIFINMHYIHHDPKVWENPDDFLPERFLSADEKKLVKTDKLNPFLVGRRQCPGETLAKDTIFLMLTTLVQNFDIVKDPKSPEIDLEPIVSFMITPKPYKAVFLERKK